MKDRIRPPVVLTCSGSDPCGGAGIEADIQAIHSIGAHAVTAITALTVQNTLGLQEIYPVNASVFLQQVRAIMQDTTVATIKLGMLGSIEIAEAVSVILRDFPNIPVVLDPILVSGNGKSVVDDELLLFMREYLFPQVLILTPNASEARRLSPSADNLNACAQALLDMGCEFVLITGGDEMTHDVANLLYSNRREMQVFHWERIPGRFHGTGCTLASAIAGFIAQGCDPATAVQEAQKYVFEAIRHAYVIGEGQWIPNRLFWAMRQQ